MNPFSGRSFRIFETEQNDFSEAIDPFEYWVRSVQSAGLASFDREG